MIAKKGDTVQVHYTGTLLDGSVFDSSKGRSPLGFKVGAGQMIPGFDSAVVGMAVGETKFATLAPAEAYGESDPNYIMQVPIADVPEDISPEVGMQLTLTDESGRPTNVLVTEVTPEYIVLDANHDLAGKTLVFEITMVSIN
jgi:peptidylprolyl isomerase